MTCASNLSTWEAEQDLLCLALWELTLLCWGFLAFILAYVRFLGRDVLLAKPFCFSWRSKCFVSSSLVSWGLALHDILGWRQSKRTQWLGPSKDQLQERWPDTASTWSAFSPHSCPCAAPTVLLPFKDEIWLLNKTRKEQNNQESCPHYEGVQRGAWASAAQAGWGAQNVCQIPSYLAVDPIQLLRLRSQLSLLSSCTVGFACKSQRWSPSHLWYRGHRCLRLIADTFSQVAMYPRTEGCQKRLQSAFNMDAPVLKEVFI